MENKKVTIIWKRKRSFCATVYLHYRHVKVKCTRVQALRFCTGGTAHRGIRGLALLFLDHRTRKGWGVSVTPRSLFTSGKDPVPIVQEAGWAPGPVWTGAENLAPTGIRSPDRPVPLPVAIPTELPGPPLYVWCNTICRPTCTENLERLKWS